YFYEFLSPPVIISSIGIFLLFKNFETSNLYVRKTAIFLSDHSYGIYLIHILVLSVLDRWGINWKIMHPVISIPVVSVFCISLSSILISGLKKIPLGRYIAG